MGLVPVEDGRLGKLACTHTVNHPHLHRGRSDAFGDSRFGKGCSIRKYLTTEL